MSTSSTATAPLKPTGQRALRARATAVRVAEKAVPARRRYAVGPMAPGVRTKLSATDIRTIMDAFRVLRLASHPDQPSA